MSNQAFDFKPKVQAAFLLFLVLVVALANNLQERNFDRQINKAITTIYKDRLVVEGYIFQYAHHLRTIDALADTRAEADRYMPVIQDMTALHDLYRATVLTESEKEQHGLLVGLVDQISQSAPGADKEAMWLLTQQANHVLNNLSAIQLEEAGLQMDNVQRLYSASNINDWLEISMLVVLTLLILSLLVKFTGFRWRSAKNLSM